MSKIYEALQKAEAERGNDHGNDPRQSHAADFGYHHAATALADPHTEHLPGLPHDPGFPEPADNFASPVADHQPGHTGDSSLAFEGLPTRVPGFDLEAVPDDTWAPSFHRLPAVLERGPSVEQFRSLRSRLYELRDKHPIRSVMVTSGLPQEGKSFVSTNLALSLARNRNARILLIDGDMRRHTVHSVLGCQRVPGLADYLAGRATLQQVVQACNTETSVGTLDGVRVHMPPMAVISGGNGGDDAADLSNNDRFEELINTLSPLFDWIIIDSSPVIPVSDAVNLSRSCDGVLIVARSGVTQYEDAQRTQAELRNANLLGVVLNAASQSDLSSSYYGYSATNPNVATPEGSQA